MHNHRCIAARQTAYSLHLQNLRYGELVLCGTQASFAVSNPTSAIRASHTQRAVPWADTRSNSKLRFDAAFKASNGQTSTQFRRLPEPKAEGSGVV
jgi:hypothetical protein